MLQGFNQYNITKAQFTTQSKENPVQPEELQKRLQRLTSEKEDKEDLQLNVKAET